MSTVRIQFAFRSRGKLRFRLHSNNWNETERNHKYQSSLCGNHSWILLFQLFCEFALLTSSIPRQKFPRFKSNFLSNEPKSFWEINFVSWLKAFERKVMKQKTGNVVKVEQLLRFLWFTDSLLLSSYRKVWRQENPLHSLQSLIEESTCNQFGCLQIWKSSASRNFLNRLLSILITRRNVSVECLTMNRSEFSDKGCEITAIWISIILERSIIVKGFRERRWNREWFCIYRDTNEREFKSSMEPARHSSRWSYAMSSTALAFLLGRSCIWRKF